MLVLICNFAKEFVCNDETDCDDGSDEKECDKATKDPLGFKTENLSDEYDQSTDNPNSNAVSILSYSVMILYFTINNCI